MSSLRDNEATPQKKKEEKQIRIEMLNERTYEASTYVAFSAATRDQVDQNRCCRTNIRDLYSIETECALDRNKSLRCFVIVTMPVFAVSKSKNVNGNL